MYHTADSLLKLPRAKLVRVAAELGLRVVARPSAVLIDDILVRQGELLSRSAVAPTGTRVALLEDQISRLEHALLEYGIGFTMLYDTLRRLAIEHAVPLDPRLRTLCTKYKSRANLARGLQ